MVGPENVLKKACFWVPYLRAYCKALRYPFELIFCVVVKDKFANVFLKNYAYRIAFAVYPESQIRGRSTVP